MLTESLGCGGAERQLCLLAVGLRSRGADVQVVTYSAGDFFRPILERGGVDHKKLRFRTRSERVFGVTRALRQAAPDVVLSFLRGPNLHAELASLPRRRWGLVVSERGALPPPLTWSTRARWRFHRLADAVVTNSHTNRLQIERAVPCLRGSVITLYNGVDLKHFSPRGAGEYGVRGVARLVVVSTFTPGKNAEGLLRAMAEIVAERPDIHIEVDWYGAVPGTGATFKEAGELATALGLKEQFRFRDPTDDIAEAYRSADAVILPSLHEGLPNAACEALSCGRPLLIGAVCDAANLVQEGRNGFMFDPRSPRSIASAIVRFADMSVEERARQAAESRVKAEQMFDLTGFVSRYQTVLRSAASRERPTVDHWVPQIPWTAVRCMSAQPSDGLGFR